MTVGFPSKFLLLFHPFWYDPSDAYLCPCPSSSNLEMRKSCSGVDSVRVPRTARIEVFGHLQAEESSPIRVELTGLNWVLWVERRPPVV
ncbi:hypothetical protein Taro_004729 [Colocasia esculenta]|uniref:Uncharacterized protein n=1 Tax=Colocasia esculenta TaxID=4460 RepID=A0A843TSL6_COLES|nr:hypothetical protein [Colocasia esculenta]